MRWALSASAAVMAATSAPSRSVLSALRLSGRLSVTVVTGPSVEVRMGEAEEGIGVFTTDCTEDTDQSGLVILSVAKNPPGR